MDILVEKTVVDDFINIGNAILKKRTPDPFYRAKPIGENWLHLTVFRDLQAAKHFKPYMDFISSEGHGIAVWIATAEFTLAQKIQHFRGLARNSEAGKAEQDSRDILGLSQALQIQPEAAHTIIKDIPTQPWKTLSQIDGISGPLNLIQDYINRICLPLRKTMRKRMRPPQVIRHELRMNNI